MNKLGGELHVTCDNDHKNEENNLEKRTINVNSVLETVSMLKNVSGIYISALFEEWSNIFFYEV